MVLHPIEIGAAQFSDLFILLWCLGNCDMVFFNLQITLAPVGNNQEKLILNFHFRMILI